MVQHFLERTRGYFWALGTHCSRTIAFFGAWKTCLRDQKTLVALVACGTIPCRSALQLKLEAHFSLSMGHDQAAQRGRSADDGLDTCNATLRDRNSVRIRSIHNQLVTTNLPHLTPPAVNCYDHGESTRMYSKKPRRIYRAQTRIIPGIVVLTSLACVPRTDAHYLMTRAGRPHCCTNPWVVMYATHVVLTSRLSEAFFVFVSPGRYLPSMVM